MNTKLSLSSAYHTKTDGQTERTNQVLEDMLRVVPFNMEEVGIRVYHMLSCHIIIVTRPV
jgi:hypothetical protein